MDSHSDPFGLAHIFGDSDRDSYMEPNLDIHGHINLVSDVHADL